MVIDPNEIMEMIFSLPEEKRDKLVANIIRRWDPDYIKLTPKEKHDLEEIMKNPEYTKTEDVDWDNLDKY